METRLVVPVPEVRVVFLDYHGVLTGVGLRSIRRPPCVSNMKAQALVALRQLKGYRLYVVSNQSGVAFGDFSERRLLRAIARLVKSLHENGIILSGFLYCPHNVEGQVVRYAVPCTCRKPSPLLIEGALRVERALKRNAILVGDTLETDIACANAAGIKSIWISRCDASTAESSLLRPTWIKPSLLAAVSSIDKYLSKREKHAKKAGA